MDGSANLPKPCGGVKSGPRVTQLDRGGPIRRPTLPRTRTLAEDTRVRTVPVVFYPMRLLDTALLPESQPADARFRKGTRATGARDG